jgi:hypothetical protein
MEEFNLEENHRFGRRLLLAVDAQGYGGGDDQQHVAIQNGLLSVLNEAATRAHLARDRWSRQLAGDGELAVLPISEPEPLVVDDFVRELAAALRCHNRDRIPTVRLRLAIHHGVAMPASMGFAGQGVVAVSRLADSEPLRQALTQSTDADLAVCLSGQVYRDTVLQGHTSLRPEDFRRVEVRVKEFTQDAWLRIPGGDVHALELSDEPRRPVDKSRPALPETDPRSRQPDMHARAFDQARVYQAGGNQYISES